MEEHLMVSRAKSAFIFLILICLCVISFWCLSDAIVNNKNATLTVNIVSFIFVFYVSIIIHELTHSLVFIYSKMRIRAFCFFPFCFIHDGTRWNIAISWKYMGALGASVPEQVAIKNEDDFRKTTKAYSNSMLAATMSGLVMTILGLLILVIGYCFLKNENLWILGTMWTFLNFLSLEGAFTRTANAAGDYFAYKYMFSNEEVSTHLIYDYMKLSVKYNEIRVNSEYLREKLVACFEKKFKEKLVDVDSIVIATTFINDFLIRRIDLPKQIEKYIEELNDNLQEFDDIKNTEVFKKYITKVAYYYEFIGNHIRAIKINYDYITNFSNGPVDKYLKMQAEQIILKKDNTSYLLKRENIKPDSYYSYYRLFDGYIEDEIILNQRINSLQD